MNQKMATKEVENLLVPTTMEEVTENWLAKALQLDMENGTVNITRNISSGYLGNMLRANYTSNGSQEDNCFVVKLLPDEKLARDLVRSEKMDKTELGVYKQFLPALIKEVPSLKPYISPFLYGEIQEDNPLEGIKYSSVLILRDLKHDGYSSKLYESHKISPEELVSAVDFLAKFHVAGTFVEISTEKPLNELFDFFQDWYYPNEVVNRPSFMLTGFVTGIGYTRKYIKNYSEITNPQLASIGKQIISEMMDPLEPYALKIYNFMLKAGQQHPCAIHGDFWQNNIMFPKTTKDPIKVIDWQMLGYTDPIYDLGFLLTTALQEDMTRESLEKYAKLYYNKVEELYRQRSAEGSPVLPDRHSWKDFWEAFCTYGLAYVLVKFLSFGEMIMNCPENIPKIFDIFKFLHQEINITKFLLKNV